MNAGAKMFRSLMLAAVLVVAAAGAARAATDPTTCTNDIDCVATPQCGGEVCDFLNTMKCVAAKGGSMDGWCTVDTDCKCNKQYGATCSGGFCTTTLPPASGAGGTTGAAGAGTSDAGAAGSGTAGTGAAGTGAAGSGSTKSSSSGGCSVGGSSSGGLVALVGLALVVSGLARRRRRA